MNEDLGEELGKAAMALLGRYGDPRAMLRLGKSRIAALFIKASRGQWREDKVAEVVAVAKSALELWDGLDGCDFSEIAEDFAAEARVIKALEAEIRELDTRAAGLLQEIDPQGLHMSCPASARGPRRRWPAGWETRRASKTRPRCARSSG